MNKRFTIIVPCYNAEKWIEQCLTSALRQTHPDVEVIFVDNESTDNSAAIANILGISEEFVDSNFIISKAKNIYPNCWDEARSEGFTLMTGDYVLVMGADDYLEEDFVEKCLDFISNDPEKIQAMQSPIRGVNSKNEAYLEPIRHSYNSLLNFKQISLNRCPVNTPTVIYNTDLYRKGLLETKPETYGGAADYDLYCNLADNGVFIYPYPKWVGFNYRWHPDQATWKVHKEGRNYDEEIQEYWRKKWKF